MPPDGARPSWKVRGAGWHAGGFLAFLQSREVDSDFTELEEVGLLVRGVLFGPLAEGQVPEITGAGWVVVILVVEAAQLKEDFVAVGITEQSFAEKALGFLDLAEIPQPVGGDGVGLDLLGVQLGGDSQPGRISRSLLPCRWVCSVMIKWRPKRSIQSRGGPRKFICFSCSSCAGSPSLAVR